MTACGDPAVVLWLDGETELSVSCLLETDHAEMEHQGSATDPRGRPFAARWPRPRDGAA